MSCNQGWYMSQEQHASAVPTAFSDLSRDELARVLESLPWVVSYWDADARLVYANDTYISYAAGDPRDLRGKHISELMGPDVYAHYEPVIEAVLAGERHTFARTTTISAGEEAHVEAEFIPHLVGGRVEGFVGVGIDVTERVLSERALSEAAKQVTLLQERQRVAEDLHDLVIQRLFAAGLDLAAAMREGPDMRERVHAAAVGVDQAIRELRGTIHELRELMTPAELPQAMARIIADSGRVLGFLPRLTATGSWDDVPPAVLNEMTAVLNEALSNVARHAQATEVHVTAAREDGLLLLRVADNGRGMDAASRRSSGLANMRSRAQKLGGHFEVKPNSPRGTVAEWRVPIHP